MIPICILVVDDNSEFLESVVRVLSSDQHLEIVGRAHSGREALEQVARLQPDLVLMDWTMPEMNGLEVTRQLKAQPDAPLIIMLTLHDTLEHRAVATAVGAWLCWQSRVQHAVATSSRYANRWLQGSCANEYMLMNTQTDSRIG